MRYPHLWTRLYNTPLLIHPEKAAVIERIFHAHLIGEENARLYDDDGPSETPEQRAEREQSRRAAAYAGISLQHRADKPYALTQGGIALIPILGSLVHRGSGMDAMSGLASYSEIAHLLETALADPDVRGAILEIDSPGGEASGIVDLAARIYGGRGKKRVWAVAADQAFSAAYWIGSQAERLYAAISGGVGSIGAVALHVDQSKRDAQMGYTYTLVYAGARKVDLNSHKPLPPEGRDRLQLEVDRFMELFTADVGKGRNISAETARATEAAILTPPQALEGGFIDGIATLNEVVALLEAALSGSTGVLPGTRMAAAGLSTSSQETTMPDKTAAELANAAKHTDAQLEAAVAKARTEAFAEGEKKGLADGEKKGGVAMIDRIRGILAHADSKDRPQLAMSLALESDMNVEQAAKILAKAAKEPSNGNAFAALMASLKNPKVGVDTAGEGGAEKPQINTAEIYARLNQRQETSAN